MFRATYKGASLSLLITSRPALLAFILPFAEKYFVEAWNQQPLKMFAVKLAVCLLVLALAATGREYFILFHFALFQVDAFFVSNANTVGNLENDEIENIA